MFLIKFSIFFHSYIYYWRNPLVPPIDLLSSMKNSSVHCTFLQKHIQTVHTEISSMFCFNFFLEGSVLFCFGFFVSLFFFFLSFFFAHQFFFLNVTEIFFINRLIGCCFLAYKNLIFFLVISLIRSCNRKRFGESAVSDNYKCLNDKYTMLLRTLTLISLSTFAQFLKLY